jgi:hypothetical protein
MKSFIVSILIICIFIPGCKKCDPLPGGKQPGCRPVQILSADNRLMSEITYTDWGAPLRIKQQTSVEQEPPYDYFFYYDQSDRLTSVEEVVVNGTTLRRWSTWKYVYEGDHIIRDTLFDFMDIISAEYDYTAVGKYTYDSHNRVTEYSAVDQSGVPLDTLKYTYPDEDPFKENFTVLAGIKELMFFNKDYSKTNQNVTGKNDKGYPTEFSKPYQLQSIDIYKVTYSCD